MDLARLGGGSGFRRERGEMEHVLYVSQRRAKKLLIADIADDHLESASVRRSTYFRGDAGLPLDGRLEIAQGSRREIVQNTHRGAIGQKLLDQM
jgi:hypothetical protein